MDQVSDEMDIEMNHTTTGEHVHEAERHIRTLKERIRCTWHSLPFKAWPKTMIKEGAKLSTEQLNYFPAKGGISHYYSPSTITTGKAIDFKKDLKQCFWYLCPSIQREQPDQLPGAPEYRCDLSPPPPKQARWSCGYGSKDW